MGESRLIAQREQARSTTGRGVYNAKWLQLHEQTKHTVQQVLKNELCNTLVQCEVQSSPNVHRRMCSTLV